MMADPSMGNEQQDEPLNNIEEDSKETGGGGAGGLPADGFSAKAFGPMARYEQKEKGIVPSHH
jgi:hypothetical protein